MIARWLWRWAPGFCHWVVGPSQPWKQRPRDVDDEPDPEDRRILRQTTGFLLAWLIVLALLYLAVRL